MKCLVISLTIICILFVFDNDKTFLTLSNNINDSTHMQVNAIN